MSMMPWSSTLQPFSINNTALSITSIQYNPFNTPSEWVDNLFGSKAHFIRNRNRRYKSYPDMYTEIRKLNITPAESELWSDCSFEVLGFVRLDVQQPFVRANKERLPLLGHGKLKIEHDNNWKCFWRVVFAQFEDTSIKIDRPTFTSVVFYCPAPPSSRKLCTDLTNRFHNYPIVNYAITMNFEYTTKRKRIVNMEWVNDFSAWTTPIYNYNNSVSTTPPDEKMLNTNLPLAMCLSIPYSSSDPDKVIANGALLAEFIRYYSMLGFKVFVYDRDGMNKEHLTNSAYMIARNITLDFVYHNYTIGGLLDESTSGLRYDNDLEKAKPLLKEIQARDKTLTNTHCRFEVKAVHKIENVMVADFDEFLYCPAAGSSFTTQRQNLQSMVHHLHNLKFGQVSFPQRWVLPREENPRDCMIRHAKSGQSVFDCFGPYRYLAGSVNSKSLHLGHKCVATDFHFSCSHTVAFNYNYNCICQYEAHQRGCSVVHLSSLLKRYTKTFPKAVMVDAARSKNELYLMTLEFSGPDDRSFNNSTDDVTTAIEKSE